MRDPAKCDRAALLSMQVPPTNDFLQTADWTFPVPIAYGPGRLDELPEHCQRLGLNKPLIITDRGTASLKFVSDAADLLAHGSIASTIFQNISQNPTESDVKVHVGGKDTRVKVSIFSEKGDLIYTRYQDIVEMSRKTNIDLSNQTTGTYIVILESKTVRKTFKVIRE